MRQKNLPQIIALALVLYISFPLPTLAYLDPGSGSYIFQIIIAGFFGLTYTIKKYWKQLRSFLVKLFSKMSK